MNNKIFVTSVMAAMVAFAGTGAFAKTDAQQASRLGQELTPTGAEQAGNAEGTIPAWTGGMTEAPAGYQPDKGYVDPFAAEKPLYTVTAANMNQYADTLTDGYKAMLSKYASYKLPVYQSHRTLALPQEQYELIKQRAPVIELADGGNGLVNYQKSSVPFPIPESGVEVIWNHMTRYRTSGVRFYPTEMVVQANGSFTPIHREITQVMAWAMKDPEPNRLYYYISKVTGPESVAGSITLLHEPIDQTKDPRAAWQYNPGQRRVLRAPEVAYDSPNALSDGLRTYDMTDMFNGAPDKFDWKLVGKREMLMPYNTYKLADTTLKYGDILQPNHLNQDLMRYELHRVWVVEATLKPGERHIYGKRVFYVDEDSWSILAADIYDGRGELWRVQEAHALQRYDVKSYLQVSDVAYDLQARRYEIYGLENQERRPQFNIEASLRDFSPAALRRSGR